jgi:hypothetical protein
MFDGLIAWHNNIPAAINHQPTTTCHHNILITEVAKTPIFWDTATQKNLEKW